MSIEIKEGRYYRDRMGQVHGPMLRSSLTYWPWTTREGRRSWTANGRVNGTAMGARGVDGGESQNDLIEEVRIVPVDREGGNS